MKRLRNCNKKINEGEIKGSQRRKRKKEKRANKIGAVKGVIAFVENYLNGITFPRKMKYFMWLDIPPVANNILRITINSIIN